MIIKPDNLLEVETILKKHFKSYKSGDPYERLAVYVQGEIVGVISYSIIYERAEINYILTLPAYRRQGVSQCLLNYALNEIKNMGCNSISLEVNKTNIPAVNLYLKNGFKEVAIRKNYYAGQDAILMIKDLEVI